MKATIIRSDKKMQNGVFLSHDEAVRLSRLSDVSAIVDLSESPRGYHVIYQDGVARLYDPVEGTIIGKHAERDGRNGWVS